MKHDYLETSLWYKEKIKDPYQVIAGFFSAADIATYRKTITRMLKAACSNRLWRKQNPGDILVELKMVESVVNAAYIINRDKMENPVIVTPNDVFNKNLYCGWHQHLTEWDYFPRSLSMKEYINPYLVFKRFFKFQGITKWKEDLKKISDYSLVNDSLSEAGMEMNMLSIYFHLTKLVEAAHLIDVREITHIGGHIKNRLKS